jgi:hypothetical protein
MDVTTRPQATTPVARAASHVTFVAATTVQLPRELVCGITRTEGVSGAGTAEESPLADESPPDGSPWKTGVSRVVEGFPLDGSEAPAGPTNRIVTARAKVAARLATAATTRLRRNRR